MDLHFLFLTKTHPFQGGGAELRTWEVARRFVDYGAKATILTSRGEASANNPSEMDGVRFEYLSSPSFATSDLDQVAFLTKRINFFLSRDSLFRELIQRGEVDLVNDDIAPFPTVYANRLCLKEGIPEVATLHILHGGLMSWLRNYGLVGFGGAVGEAMLRSKVFRFTHIITDSHWLREDLRRNFEPERITWIPNGVDVQRFRPLDRTDSPQKSVQPLRLLCVGRFVGWKGHHLLLRSFAEVLKDEAQIHLTLVGTGPRLERTRTLAEDLNIRAHVSFAGWIPHSEMPDVYRKSHVFVLPSAAEGLSVALIEALSSGLPVIATDVPGNRAVIPDSAGLLVRQSDRRELADAIRALVRDPELRINLGNSARRTAVENFSWNQVALDQFRLFRRCLN